jgi:phosphatidylserine decarboxylase
VDPRPASALRPAEGPAFEERLTGPFTPEAYVFALPLGLLGAVGLAAGVSLVGAALLALGLFCALFFRNPSRAIPGAECDVVAPADGRVVAAGPVELPDGRKALRVGIFLSIFDVHVNRVPVAGRVVAIERAGERFLAAFAPDAEHRNVRLAMELETAGGERVTVVQITGLIARRIVCQPRVGQTLARGVRYGLIRFGSRTDVWLPVSSELRVRPGQRVRGGADVVARLRPEAVEGVGR